MNCLNSLQHPRPFLGSSFTPPVISGLVQYVTFDKIYNALGEAWTSGTQYAGNIATSNSPTSLYQSLGATFDNTVSNALISGSVYTGKNPYFRWNGGSGGYVFPENTGLSFSLWVRMTALSANYGGPFGIGGLSPSFQFLALRFYQSGSVYHINLAVDINNNNGGGLNTNAGSISFNQWNHLVWTISPSAYGASATYKLYKNGSIIYSGTGVYPNNGSRIYNDIGAIPGWGTFAGNIDMFRYYSVRLNDADVSNIYTTYDRNIIR